MSNRKELWGLRFEIVGLVALLLGAFWQANFSGWWDKTSFEWQNYIQDETNRAVLLSLRGIANLEAEKYDENKEALAKNIIENIDSAYSLIANEKSKRDEALKTGQAAKFWEIEKYLMLIGALFLVIGKWMTLQGVKDREQ